MTIDKDQFNDWLNLPVTNVIFDKLKERKQEALDCLVNYSFDDKLMFIGELRGIIRGMDSILNVSYEEVEND